MLIKICKPFWFIIFHHFIIHPLIHSSFITINSSASIQSSTLPRRFTP
jgi:hypothetical protein